MAGAGPPARSGRSPGRRPPRESDAASRRTRTDPITPGDPAMPAPAPSRWTLALFAFALGSLSTLALVGGAYYAINRARQSQSPPPPRPVYSRPEFSRRV